MDSEIDRSSLISTDTTTMFIEKTPSCSTGRLENWTDLLWPQPKYIDLDERYVNQSLVEYVLFLLLHYYNIIMCEQKFIIQKTYLSISKK